MNSRAVWVREIEGRPRRDRRTKPQAELHRDSGGRRQSGERAVIKRRRVKVRHLAIHEAAHAVIALYYRKRIERVTIDPRDRYWDPDVDNVVEGHVKRRVGGKVTVRHFISTNGGRSYRERLRFENPLVRNDLVIFAAGAYASQVEGYVDNGWADYEASEEVLRANGATEEQIEKEIRSATRRASRLVLLLRGEILAVAEALVERKSLTGKEVKAILRSAELMAHPRLLASSACSRTGK